MNKLRTSTGIWVAVAVVVVLVLCAVVGVNTKDPVPRVSLHAQTDEMLATKSDIPRLTSEIAKSPKQATLYAMRGNAYHDAQQYKEAADDFTKAISLRGAAIDFRLRAREYNDLEKENESLSDLNKAIELDPALAAAYVDRGYIYKSQGRDQEALDDFTKAISLGNDESYVRIKRAEIYLKLNQIDKAKADYSKAADGGGYFGKDALVAHAKLVLAEGNKDGALADIRRMTTCDGSAFTYEMQGDYLKRLGRADEANNAYQIALRLQNKELGNSTDPDSSDYATRGDILKKLGRSAEAKADFERALKADLKAAQADPDDTAAWDKVVDRAEDAGDGRALASAKRSLLAAYAKAIKAEPKDASLLHERGGYFWGQTMFKEALADYIAASNINPGDADYHSHIADCALELNDPNRAIAEAQKAVRLGGDNADEEVILAKAYLALKDYRQAESRARAAVALNNSSQDAYEVLSQVLSKLGQKEKAEQARTKAAALGFDHDPAESDAEGG